MKYLKLLILTIGFISCDNRHVGEQKPTLLSNLISISDNEDKGVKDILEFYGGYCEYAFGTSVSVPNGGGKYFELKLSKSKVIEKHAKSAEMSASNIAFLFFKNLNKEERENYDEIRTVLIFSNGQKMTFKIPTTQLALVETRMKSVKRIVEIIKEKNFEALRPLLSGKGFVTYDKNELISNLNKYDSQFGNVTDGFIPLGYRLNKANDGKDVLQISGYILRDKHNNEFSVYLDLNSKTDTIYILQYKL